MTALIHFSPSARSSPPALIRFPPIRSPPSLLIRFPPIRSPPSSIRSPPSVCIRFGRVSLPALPQLSTLLSSVSFGLQSLHQKIEDISKFDGLEKLLGLPFEQIVGMLHLVNFIKQSRHHSGLLLVLYFVFCYVNVTITKSLKDMVQRTVEEYKGSGKEPMWFIKKILTVWADYTRTVYHQAVDKMLLMIDPKKKAVKAKDETAKVVLLLREESLEETLRMAYFTAEAKKVSDPEVGAGGGSETATMGGGGGSEDATVEVAVIKKMRLQEGSEDATLEVAVIKKMRLQEVAMLLRMPAEK